MDTHRQEYLLADICMYIINVGGYSNKAVSYNNCAEDNINIELQ